MNKELVEALNALEKEKEIRLKRIFVKPIYSYEDVDIIEKQYEYEE